MTDWQPIETAPKNGKPILLNNDRVRARCPYSVGYFKINQIGEGYWASFPASAYPLSPTHWMPLPEPPK